MYNIKINEREVGWTPLEIAGVSMKVLHKHEATGAMAVLTRMNAGATIPAHFHTQADETVYVIAGDFVEDGVRATGRGRTSWARRACRMDPIGRSAAALS
jgi:hypothetical protein